MVAPNGTVYLKDVPAAGEVGPRARLWMEKLEKSPFLAKNVEEMYRGAHWQQSRQSYEAARQKFEPSLWILSAGYGLIPAFKGLKIKPYQATFSQENALDASESNAVSPSNLKNDERLAYERAWWHELSMWRKPFGTHPRSLSELFDQEGFDCALLIGSEYYLRVVEDDLVEAAGKLYHPERFIVASAGVSDAMRRRLNRHMLNFDARMAQKLGGAMGSLNARVGAWLMGQLEYANFNLRAIQALIDAELENIPKRTLPQRESMTVDQVRDYLRSQPDLLTLSASQLLHRFRRVDQKAFEEKYFRRLAAEIKDQYQQSKSPPLSFDR